MTNVQIELMIVGISALLMVVYVVLRAWDSE